MLELGHGAADPDTMRRAAAFARLLDADLHRAVHGRRDTAARQPVFHSRVRSVRCRYAGGSCSKSAVTRWNRYSGMGILWWFPRPPQSDVATVLW